MRVSLNQNSEDVENKTKISELKDAKMLGSVTFLHNRQTQSNRNRH